jgi:hypothetical protein
MEKKDIIEWLSKKGFPFEIECFKMFKSSGFTCQQSLHYTDIETGKTREIDLCAYKQIHLDHFTFNVSFLIECKDSQTPWLAITNKHDFTGEDFSSNLIGTKNTNSLKTSIGKSNLKSFSFNIERDEIVAYNIQQINTKSVKDMAYEAVQQAMNCCLSLRENANESQMSFANLYIPVVITSSLVYSLNTNTELNEENLIEEKFIKLTNVNSFSKTPISIIHIVSGKYLNEYCEKVESEFHLMGNKFKDEITKILKENPSNSNKGKYI